MENIPQRTSEYFSEAYEKYANTIYRIAVLHLKNRSDAQDIVSDTYVKLIEKAPQFQNDEHQKAWLIRTAINISKNKLKSGWFRIVDKGESFFTDVPEPYERELLHEVMGLPVKYRTAIYMYYYEGYSTNEIACLLRKKDATVRSQLARGRKTLKKVLEGENEK